MNASIYVLQGPVFFIINKSHPNKEIKNYSYARTKTTKRINNNIIHIDKHAFEGYCLQ